MGEVRVPVEPGPGGLLLNDCCNLDNFAGSRFDFDFFNLTAFSTRSVERWNERLNMAAEG
jgi:hypothetical protein